MIDTRTKLELLFKDEKATIEEITQYQKEIDWMEIELAKIRKKIVKERKKQEVQLAAK